MPWLPVLNTVLPYLTTIVTAAVPHFTGRKDGEQIAELQEAVKRNAESVKVLAEQMQRTIHAIEAGAASAERAIKQARMISAVALVIAAASLCTALIALWLR
jgi:hypothetical protein